MRRERERERVNNKDLIVTVRAGSRSKAMWCEINLFVGMYNLDEDEPDLEIC